MTPQVFIKKQNLFRIVFPLFFLWLSPLPVKAETLSIGTCLTEALSKNPAVKEGELALDASEKGVLSARLRHLPKLSIDGNYTRREETVPYIPAKSTTVPAHFSDEFGSLQAVLSIPLYQGGQISNNVTIAGIKKDLIHNAFTMTKNEIIANVVNTYNKLLHLKQLEKASDASVNALERQYANTSMMLDIGRIARVDFLKVDVQLAGEKQRLATLREGIASSSETLAYLLGRDVGSGQNLPEPQGTLIAQPFQPDFETGVALAKGHRPEYLMAENSVRESELNVKNVKGKLLPSVSAFGGYMDQKGFEPSYSESSWFAGINVSVPLFEGPLYADIAREKILNEKAKIHLKGVDNQIRLDIRNALSALSDSRERVGTSEKAVAQAEESFKIEGEKYTSGAGAMVEYLLSQAAYFTASANYAQALYDYNAAMVSYRRATGSMEEYLK
ncbi:MAG: TolC family protein [Desulfobacteraceae bacterium]